MFQDWESHFISEDGYLSPNISVLEEHVEVMEVCIAETIFYESY